MNNMKKLFATVFGMAMTVFAVAETTESVTTVPFALDIRTGVREARATEPITYDAAWFGGDGAETVVTVLRDGVDSESLHSGTGAGTVDWTPTRPGLYTLTHETLEGGVSVGETYTAQFHVAGVEYTVAFNANGGLGSMESLDCSSGTPVTLPLCNFRRDGYDFTGWSDGSSAYADGAVVSALSETAGTTVTLVAQWTKHVEDGCYVVIDVSGGPTAERYPVTFLDQVPEGGWTDEYKTTKIVLRKIPHGTFMKGHRETDYPGAINKHLHEVTLTKDFYAGVFEMTQKQWELVMGSNPSEYTGDKRPVENVSYNMVRGADLGAQWPNSSSVDPGSFMSVMRQKTGLDEFDLPTDAQWEYACRAGTTTALNSGKNLISTNAYCRNLAEVGRYVWNSGKLGPADGKGGDYTEHTTVGSYLPNSWGLYDMHGNVNEQCLDYYLNLNTEPEVDPLGPTHGTTSSGNTRLYHGGCHFESDNSLYTAAVRHSDAPGDVSGRRGFRLFATVTDNEAGLQVPYAVHFEPNGAQGSMEDMTCILGVATNLTQCQFRRDGYDFTGWSTNGTEIAFADEALVHDLTSVGNSVVTLTAQWTKHVEDGCYVVIDVSGGPTAERYPVTFLDQVPEGGWTDEYKTEKIVLRKILHGTFIMGSPTGELGRDVDETLHSVTLTKDFYAGVFEMTQKQWELVMGTKPSYFDNVNCYASRPVEFVSYNGIRGSSVGAKWPSSNAVDAGSFLGKMRAKTGVDAFDLPTDAQWEYACRAGTTTSLNSGKNLMNTGVDENVTLLGRYRSNGGNNGSDSVDTGGGTAKSGSYVPNAWGLYDTHGNLWEWCLDWFGNLPSSTEADPSGPSSGSGRVSRGGGWSNTAKFCRSGSRTHFIPSGEDSHTGFRLFATVADNEAGLLAPVLASATGFDGAYDGTGHGIEVAVSVPASGATVTYAADPNGPFSATIPLSTNVCTTSVWYRVEAPHYIPYTNSATVRITAPANAVWYVDATNGVDTADGTSWATAKKTIQAAIDAAVDGNTVIVTNGVYDTVFDRSQYIVINRNLRQIYIESVNGPAYTVIDGRNEFRCVKMGDGVYTNLMTLDGFTLQNGYHKNAGGATHGNIKNCVIRNCHGVSDAGGLVACHAENCLIIDNTTEDASDSQNPAGVRRSLLVNCTVSGNHWDPRGADGRSSVGRVDGVRECTGFNTIVFGNGSCDILPQEQNALSGGAWCFTDPRFVDAAHGDFRLKPDSPCINAGGNDCVTVELDLDGNPRIVGGKVDLGCYEVQTIAFTAEDFDVTLTPPEFIYDGTAKEPSVTVASATATLVAGTDFTVSYENNVNAGTAKAVVTGAGVYIGAITNEFTITPAPIRHVADGSTGEYCGRGYGISVNVSTPASGYTVKYAESAEGPWADTLLYTNVCAAKPVWYRISAPNYATVTNSAPVTVTAKELTADMIWLVLPAEDYVYDGTAKEPEVAFGDGDPSILTEADWSVTFTDNIDAGTATATFTGRGNYTGSCSEEFEILKAANAWTTQPAIADWTYGQTPSAPVAAAKTGEWTVTYSGGAKPTLPGSYTATFTVPESKNYNALTAEVPFRVIPATVRYVADGVTGEYCGSGYGISVSVSTPASGYTVKYAESAEGPWADTLLYTNVCAAKAMYFTIAATGYAPVTNSAAVTITAKELTTDMIWLVLPAEDYVYDGTAKEPEVAFGDGDPSILTEADFTVTYTDNIDAGTATATFTGRGNYTGSCTEEFGILPREVTLVSADGRWTYDAQAHANAAVTVSSGSFLAGEGVTTNGFATITDVGETPNAFSYAFLDGTKAGNYAVACVTGTLAVVPAKLSPDDDPDPRDPSVDPDDPSAVNDPATRFSVFDYVGVYDGEAHTVDTNALAAAYADLFLGNVPSFSYAAASNGVYGAVAPAFTDVVATSFWYRVSAANFDEVIHPCKVVVTNRCVTLTSGSKTDFVYDGAPHAFTNLAVSAGGFVAGEGISTSAWATVTSVAEGEVPNAFAYAPLDGTKLSNYALTVVTGVLAVVQAENVWTVEPSITGWTYGEPAHEASGAAKFGTVAFAFSPASVGAAGDYTLTASVAGTADYTGLSADIPFVILPAKLSPDDDPDPRDPSVDPDDPAAVNDPATRFSVFDYIGVYDGEAHTVDTNALSAAYADLFLGNAPSFSYAATSNGVYGAVAPAFTDVVATSFWYRVSAANFDEVIHPCKVVVTNRCVTLTSADGQWTYDGVAHANTDISVGGAGFAAGEGVETSGFATITDVGETPNAFSYVFPDGTKAGNYAVTCVTGTLTVVKADNAWTAEPSVTGKVYDGAPAAVSAGTPKFGAVTVTYDGGSPAAPVSAGAHTAAFSVEGTANYGPLEKTVAYAIAKAALPGDGEEPGEGDVPKGGLSKFDATHVYNGKGRTIDIEKLTEAFAPYASEEEASQFHFATAADGPWSVDPPTVTDVGELVVWYRVTSLNYEDFVHAAKVTVVPKEITDEMVQPGEDAFFFDGAEKKPTVDVVYEVDGRDICTEDDYTLVYGEKAGAGWWVTVTGHGNYTGAVTKIVPVLKRPVAPPVVPGKAYNGKTQTPQIPVDSRWTVVSNPGGVNVGEYTNVVLRLTDAVNYKWKGGAEDETDITLVFLITRANNGWSRQPDMKGWEYGATPSEPNMGQARYGTVQVAYRKAGTDVSAETPARPELPGKYIARFWVDETENYIGVALSAHKEIAFEITGTAPDPVRDHTVTTPVPVPYAWLEPYLAAYAGGKSGDEGYETAGNATGANGVALWESYVAGLDPADPDSRFIVNIRMDGDTPVVTWSPDLRTATPPRVYTILGKPRLGEGDWAPVTDFTGLGAAYFFKVTVEMTEE